MKDSSFLYANNFVRSVNRILVKVFFVSLICVFSNNSFAISIDDVIKICNAGLSKSASAELSADLKGILAGQASLSAKAQDEIKGVFLNSDKLTSEDKVKSYTIYISCLEKFMPRSSCEDNCQRKQKALKTGLESQRSDCMKNRRLSCFQVCRNEYNYDTNTCISDLCNPLHESNILNWESICEDSLESDIQDADDKYRKCVSRC